MTFQFIAVFLFEEGQATRLAASAQANDSPPMRPQFGDIGVIRRTILARIRPIKLF
jgi:hypothetical protein